MLLGRTRFGFDLRATGLSETAAVASGVNVKRMIIVTMLISGGVAGLVGLPLLLGAAYTFAQDFQTGSGFAGIAIALLGRNNPIGIAIGALLWSFLDSRRRSSTSRACPKEIVTIMQGVIVLSVVIAYELVRRFSHRRSSSAGSAPSCGGSRRLPTGEEERGMTPPATSSR